MTENLNKEYILKIIACIKQVPDSEAKVRADNGQINTGEAPLVINPFDEYAVEGALQPLAHFLQRQAGVVGGDGEQPASTVHEDGELDLGGTAVVKELVEGGLHRAAGKKHLVDEDDGGARAEELAAFGADLWWLSPPCQPYSVRGRGRDLDDPRARTAGGVV